MRIGYASLGTFTSQFTRVVGVPPGRFGRLVQNHADVPFHEVLQRLGETQEEPAHAALEVSVSGSPDAGTPVAVGLFESGIPQRRPAGCSVVQTPGNGSDRRAAGRRVPAARDVLQPVRDGPGGGGRHRSGPLLGRGHAGPDPHLGARRCHADHREPALRRRGPTDPPILLALPLLMAVAEPQLHRG